MSARCGRWRDSRHEIVRKVKEAIAPLDAAGDALADNGAGAAEGGDGGLAPRRVVRMDDRGRGARGYLFAQFDEGLEKSGVGGIDVIILAAHLHDPSLGRGRRRLAAPRPAPSPDARRLAGRALAV